MPKRVVDGEAIWSSRKLKSVPEDYRLHYANWIPMADVDGVFEADPDIIWSRVYAFLCPNISANFVNGILASFIDSGLVRVWKTDNKMLGYFIGIEKPGRLPSEEHKRRYKDRSPIASDKADNLVSGKDLAPCREIPGNSGNMPEGFGLGFGVGLGMEGYGREGNEMSFKTKITDTARRVLHVRLRPDDNQWPEVNALVRVHGLDVVLDAFEVWAESVKGDNLSYPLSKFVDKADGIIGGDIQLKADDRLNPLILQLAVLSDGEVSFNQKQSAAIGKLLADNTPDEIESAFREFYSKLQGNVQFAGKDFSEKAPQFLAVMKHRKAESIRQAELLEAARQQSESEAPVVEPEVEDDFFEKLWRVLPVHKMDG